MALCKVMIIGNLGADPEMRYTPSGRPVTQFNVAVNQSTKNQQTGEWNEETDWFRVSVWGDRAERAAENLRKGNRVFVEGRFKTREFEGRDGQKRTSLEITADSLVNLEKRTREEGDAGQFAAAAPAGASAGAPGGAPSGGGSRGNGGNGGGGGGGGGGSFDEGELDDLPF
jgi:single-strand DNA-binding protein